MPKVHGSVLKAGKVKSQTPKASFRQMNTKNDILTIFGNRVEPTEKPKTLKGRAHKREIYTRLFVNVITIDGKRKVQYSA